LLNPSSENYNLRNLFWEYLKYFKNEDKEIKKVAIMSTSIEDAVSYISKVHSFTNQKCTFEKLKIYYFL